MRLEQPEPVEGQFPGLFRQSSQLVHTRTECQIVLTVLCHLVLRVTAVAHSILRVLWSCHLEASNLISASAATSRIAEHPRDAIRTQAQDFGWDEGHHLTADGIAQPGR